jgi:DNA recombination protein RmuC
MVLENSLKSFGLERGRDFLIEHTINDVVDGKRLRPDAVVYLPFDSVLVIDSKASKFLIELAAAESEDDSDAAAAGLARTMNQHLRALAGKDYQRAIVDSYRAAGRAGEIRRVLNVMYLPNEGAVEKLRRADPGFEGKAAKERIIIAGPSGLNSIIAFASLEIDLGRQAENQERIVESTQRLLESTGIVLGHIDKVGKGIRSAAQNFISLTGSINRRLLPRAHELANLGVRPAKNKDLPKSVAAYELVDRAGDGVIEGEAEEVGENNLIGHDDGAG